MEEENVGEVKKYDYFMLEYWNDEHTMYTPDYAERNRKDVEFLSKYPEVEILDHSFFFKVEHNLVRKLKIKNLNKILSISKDIKYDNGQHILSISGMCLNYCVALYWLIYRYINKSF